MGKYIPVDPEKWAAMVIAQSDLVRYKEICDELDAECTRLKAKVERLTKAADEVDAAWSVYENGLIETPEWVKRSQVRDAVSRLWHAAKEGKQP